jgi:transposase-like protein
MLTMDKTDVTNGELLIERIDSYSDRVRKRAVPCAMTVCPHCGLDAASAQTPFTCHGARPRRFLVLVGPYVRKVAGLLARWRCPRCRRTFTDYPPFASPYKAYTLLQMTERAARYISNDWTSYRKGVCSASLPIFYAHWILRPATESPNVERPKGLGRPQEVEVPSVVPSSLPEFAPISRTPLLEWKYWLPKSA